MRRWMSVRAVGPAAVVTLLVGSAGACSGFKNGSSGGDGGSGVEGGSSSSGGGSSSSGSSSGGSSSGASSSSSGSSSGGADSGGDGSATGAGPLGDLPSGYCCTSAADCRNRNCVDLGGGNKMCEDECDNSAQTACTGLLPGFTCAWDDAGAFAFCVPLSPTTACVPASQYVHGTKPTGACCTATGDATSGNECLGGNCGATGSDTNPYVCGNACSSGADCPAEYQCLNLGFYSVCVPLADPYTCQ